MFYRNAMQAVWLDYTTRYIMEQDLNLIDLHNREQDKESTSIGDRPENEYF